MAKIKTQNLTEIKTLGALKEFGYKSKSIKEELRQNLIAKLQRNEKIFENIIGYENTVMPELERAILAKHNINFLGLRGQAKTKIARQITNLLDEWIPIVEGSELNDDPLAPISFYAKNLIAEKGDNTPISWLHRSERYAEKLATPDVTVADLIGDIDPIKAAKLNVSYADERAIHFGIIPRSNRCVFVINELPDLQARNQVALFNILQEGDVQIRGYKIRFNLDIQFVFTANPEDYSNRGSMVTPLKDRIGSQIHTHYPQTLNIAKNITKQEAKNNTENEAVEMSDFVASLIEQIAFEARSSEFIDMKSGVSARLSISIYELVMSAAERRMLLNGETKSFVRISDLYTATPAISGKIELLYEGEQEGIITVVQGLISKAIRNFFVTIFPNPVSLKRSKSPSPYRDILNWFGENNSLSLLQNENNKTYFLKLDSIEALNDLVKAFCAKCSNNNKYVMKEYILHALAEYSQISKTELNENAVQFNELFSNMFKLEDLDR